MMTCWILAGIFGAIVLLHLLFEIHYFLRMFLTILLAKYCKKKIHILDEASLYSICITTDIDIFLHHMNNARYLRELDFARADFYERTGLCDVIRSQRLRIVQGATTIRYRRFLKPLTIYKITSKIIYWDEKSFIMEHRFVTPKDGFIRAIAICKQRILDHNAETLMNLLLNQEVKKNDNAEPNITQITYVKPNIPPDVAKWLESNEISSAILRQSNTPTVNTTTTTLSTITTTTTATTTASSIC